MSPRRRQKGLLQTSLSYPCNNYCPERDSRVTGDMPRAAALVAALSFSCAVAINVPPKMSALPFNLSAVTLKAGSTFDSMQYRNAEFLLGLDHARLLCLYTSAANLSGTISEPTCEPYDHPRYWGHYLGHWLSATAMVAEGSHHTDIAAQAKAKSAAVIAELSRVQDTWSRGGSGYEGFLYPYDRVSFDRLLTAPFENCQPVCVPFYVMHKMFAGLLDQHTRAANRDALPMVIKMAAWVKTNVEAKPRILKPQSENPKPNPARRQGGPCTARWEVPMAECAQHGVGWHERGAL